MKSLLLLTLGLLIFSCGQDDDGPGPQANLSFVGVYIGSLNSADGTGNSLSLDSGIQAEISETSNTETSITISDPVNGIIDEFTFSATRTSPTLFEVSNLIVDGIMLMGSVSLNGSTLSIQLSGMGGAFVTYVGERQ